MRSTSAMAPSSESSAAASPSSEAARSTATRVPRRQLFASADRVCPALRRRLCSPSRKEPIVSPSPDNRARAAALVCGLALAYALALLYFATHGRPNLDEGMFVWAGKLVTQGRLP